MVTELSRSSRSRASLSVRAAATGESSSSNGCGRRARSESQTEYSPQRRNELKQRMELASWSSLARTHADRLHVGEVELRRSRRRRERERIGRVARNAKDRYERNMRYVSLLLWKFVTGHLLLKTASV